ncbi:isoprenylcysteine carboxyl methyltransferase family protein [Bacillus sp. PS06]|uniref:isoprenylcysteine carboxyl methyltransferase family protein n=1 Tax=Bacillus sp. PS06 TaxID=2764176 RepID=UPI00177B39F6|nr:isoprenylcysteine carboxylmethyltransferase family protein [Bacillus sp. PS06]MBD8068157.1 hypothetical protein [Bacillus sp. PS06]
MLYFVLFFSFLLVQRLVELYIAKKNEAWMKANGAYEVGEEHYKYIVGIHILFFLSYFIEVYQKGTQFSSWFPFLMTMFVLTQLIRIWIIKSLGRYWNTKIIILPNKEIITRGPYRFLRHPNYVVVVIELMLIPLIFNAYLTAILFSILNLIILSIRIPAEEEALIKLTDYEDKFSNTQRFFPRTTK